MNDGGPAFPVMGFEHHEHREDNVSQWHTHFVPGSTVLGGGMTLRDWFAGQALMGFMSDHQNIRTLNEIVSTEELPLAMAKMSYTVADKMIAEREKTCNSQ